MKVLSIQQPWASLIIQGHKRIETRSWNTKYRGDILIHASSGKMIDTIPHDNIFWKFYHLLFAQNKMEPICNLPTGAIIGKLTLMGTFKSEDLFTYINHNEELFRLDQNEINAVKAQEQAFGDYTPGRYGWLLSDPVLFPEPIPAKGKLGLWDFDLEQHVDIKFNELIKKLTRTP